MRNWIDLKDKSGARLKLAQLDVGGQQILHLFITNLSFINPSWRRCVAQLGFREAPNRKYLVRRVEADEKIKLSTFKAVFPHAAMSPMDTADYMLSLPSRPASRASAEPAAGVDLRGVQRLGRNANGQEVYDSLSGRFVLGGRDGAERVMESADRAPGEYLRLARAGEPLPTGDELSNALIEAARGFVRSMDQGEVQHSEDYQAFRKALFPQEQVGQLADEEIDEMLSRAIDGALLRHVQHAHSLAGEAFLPMARLYDYLPPHSGKPRGAGVVPQPLNVAVQRLLGDTSDKTVLVPQAFDGASFAFLPEGTRVRAFEGLYGQSVGFGGFAVEHPGVRWMGTFSPAMEHGAEAMLFNADPDRDDYDNRLDYHDALVSLRSLAPGARAVLVLAADGGAVGQVSAESAAFLRSLAARVSVEDVFETAPILSQKAGGIKGLRVYSLRNVPGTVQAIADFVTTGVRVLSSWEEVKTHIDETLAMLQVREAESDGIDLERAAEQENYQRPYIAFSRVGEARTMLPANMQSSAQAYLTRLEQLYGQVDEFVGKQLGMGFATLQQNFSPEQVDGIAVMISRQLVGRSSILADDTGIGKGRQLAAMATWANKRAANVVFVTDRANLFSDLARDLKHIGEWERFRPLVLNADGEITYEEYPGAEPTVLAKGTSAPEMARILESGASIEDLQKNVVFLTYSQIATAESPKALWIKNQLANSLVIFDEAHIAAGSDSNVAVQVAEMANLAKYCQFASATWAKSHLNMHIYQRAFPASVSVATLSETMRKGGESFSEIFSGMLSHDGALIRREHDLSKLEVEMRIDEQRRQRNERVSDLVADVLGAASYINGDMQQVFMRSNADSVSKLKHARDVRLGQTRQRAKLFSSGFGAGSVIYEVMKGVQGALNADYVGDLAVQSVRDGMKPVIVSDATGERLLEEVIARELESRQERSGTETVTHVQMPTLRDLLRRVVLRHLATIRVAEVELADIEDADLRDIDEGATDQGAGGDVGAIARAADQAGAAVAVALEAGIDDRVDEVGAPINDQQEVVVDVAAAFAGADPAPMQRVGQDQRAVATAQEENDEAAPKPKSKRRIRYVDVPISELQDMPQEARDRYAQGLQELQTKIQAVPDIPVLCFDVIAQRLRNEGFTVGELSGRKKRLEWDEQAQSWAVVGRSTSKKSVKSSIRAFNNGGLQALVINRSVATGNSMHSSPRFLDQSRRHLIEHQIPENPVDRIQLLGRVNRFDQLSSPLITTSSTGIYGEVRYLMMQNKKLARMSANVRSSRDNAMSLKSVRDLFNVVGKEAVEEFLGDNALVSKRLGLSQSDIESSPDLVNKVTMRIPLLTVKQQEMVYNDLYSRMDEILFRAELEGVNPLKPGEMDLRASTLRESVFFGEELQDDAFSSAFDAPVMARKITWSRMLKPMSYAAMKGICDVNVDRLVDAGLLEIVDAPAVSAADVAVPMSADRGVEIDDLDADADDAFEDGLQNAGGAVARHVGPRLKPEMVNKVLEGFRGLMRLSHMSSDIQSFTEAAKEHPQTRRAFIKFTWLEKNLPILAPGVRLMDNRPEKGNPSMMDLISSVNGSIIVDVKPPEQAEQLLDLGKWQISVISPGDERPKSFSLRTIVSKVEGSIAVGEITGDVTCSHLGQYITSGVYSPNTLRRVENSFEFVRRGERVAEGLVLTGNVYLAAEWAAATGTGRPIIYTDESGQRHRAIGLPKDVGSLNPEYLPMRVADPDAVRRFMLPMMLRTTTDDPQSIAPGSDVHLASNAAQPNVHGVYVVDTTFKSAMAHAVGQGLRSSVIVIEPKKMVAITCAAEDVRRVRAALAAGQKAIRKSVFGRDIRAADDPASVSISVAKNTAERNALPAGVAAVINRISGGGGGADWSGTGGGRARASKTAVISMKFSTLEQAERALLMLRAHSGLEVYAAQADMREAARAALMRAASDRREQLRQRQMEASRQESGEGSLAAEPHGDEAAEQEHSRADIVREV